MMGGGWFEAGQIAKGARWRIEQKSFRIHRHVACSKYFTAPVFIDELLLPSHFLRLEKFSWQQFLCWYIIIPRRVWKLTRGEGGGEGRREGWVQRYNTSDREEQRNKFEEKKNHFLIVFL